MSNNQREIERLRSERDAIHGEVERLSREHDELEAEVVRLRKERDDAARLASVVLAVLPDELRGALHAVLKTTRERIAAL